MSANHKHRFVSLIALLTLSTLAAAADRAGETKPVKEFREVAQWKLPLDEGVVDYLCGERFLLVLRQAETTAVEEYDQNVAAYILTVHNLRGDESDCPMDLLADSAPRLLGAVGKTVLVRHPGSDEGGKDATVYATYAFKPVRNGEGGTRKIGELVITDHSYLRHSARLYDRAVEVTLREWASDGSLKVTTTLYSLDFKKTIGQSETSGQAMKNAPVSDGRRPKLRANTAVTFGDDWSETQADITLTK